MIRTITNAEFAERVGLHFSSVSKIRRGSRLPSVDKLRVISKEFDLPADEVLKKASEGPEAFSAYIRTNVFGEAEPYTEL